MNAQTTIRLNNDVELPMAAIVTVSETNSEMNDGAERVPADSGSL